MDNKVCMHCLVSGRVQGVFFRANTQEQAKKLGLTGWVRNLADGRVELIACGDKSKLDKLISWLNIGPDLAEVKKLETNQLDWQDHDKFLIK